MTSKLWLPRLPARAGLDIAALAPAPVDAPLADSLAAAAGVAGTVYRLGPADGVDRFFRLDPCDGTPPLFIKVVPEAHAARQTAAGEVARFVAEREVLASPPLPDFPRPLGSEYALFAHRFVAGGPMHASEDALRMLGTTAARLHRALVGWPHPDHVRDEAERRRKLLAQTTADVLSGRIRGERVAEIARRAMAARPDAFHAAPPDARMVHGDLNPGNIILRETDGAPVVLDFEESLHSWLSPAVDLAVPIERVVLVGVADDARAVRLGCACLEGYRNGGGQLPNGRGWLAETLQWLVLRSLALLSHFDAVATPWPDREWRKFDDLLALHQRRQAVIEAIEAAM